MGMQKTELDAPLEERIAWVEREMEGVLADKRPALDLYRMLRYHLGWLDAELQPVTGEARRRAGGKKIRGALCLLACEAAGGDPQAAVPGAAAVEFVHNFSLIHDDVEDEDAERRHRPTVWKRWSVAHAVNAGSNMQALVNTAGLRLLRNGVPAERVVAALDCLTRAMLAMTEGQFRDIEFQDAPQTSIDAYLEMSGGKTAALTEAATRLGCLIATDRAEPTEALARFGRAFGMAFQSRDDYLGIWGEPERTGKPVGGDILKGKRSLPIVYALSRDPSPELRRVLEQRDVAAVTARLEEAGARAYVEEMVAGFTAEAIGALDEAALSPRPCETLRGIAREFLGRSG
jgi:geranylgeranyl diphosphate synthase type I